jgi:hypothetical protein
VDLIIMSSERVLNQGYLDMMEDIRNGNHKGPFRSEVMGICLNLEGWANPCSSGRYRFISTKAAAPEAASDASQEKGTKRAHAAMDKDKENPPDWNSNKKIARMGHAEDKRLHYTPENCQELRIKIESFIHSQGMTASEFQKAIKVNANSYNEFMTEGEVYDILSTSILTYTSALAFFQKREKHELKALSTSHPQKKTKVSNKAPGKAGNPKFDVSEIHLDGEEKCEVEVFETCDSLRRMVAAHLRKDGVIQAEFLREVSKQFGNNPKKLQAKQLQTFQSYKGPHTGAAGAFFYGAYVYLEKLRIKDKKPKSAFRQNMEVEWDSGFPRDGNKSYLITAGSRVCEDKFGKVRIL